MNRQRGTAGCDRSGRGWEGNRPVPVPRGRCPARSLRAGRSRDEPERHSRAPSAGKQPHRRGLYRVLSDRQCGRRHHVHDRLCPGGMARGVDAGRRLQRHRPPRLGDGDGPVRRPGGRENTGAMGLPGPSVAPRSSPARRPSRRRPQAGSCGSATVSLTSGMDIERRARRRRGVTPRRTPSSSPDSSPVPARRFRSPSRIACGRPWAVRARNRNGS